MKEVIMITSLFMMCLSNGFAQDVVNSDNSKIKVYAGYDLGEMAFNKFQNFGGELGLGLKNEHIISFVYLNVKLTEEHLSSGFARAVDGDDISGHWIAYEGSYNIPIYHFKKDGQYIYAGLSAGYHKNSYQHEILDASVEHDSFTTGINLGFRESNIFKIRGLYFNLQIPIRYYFMKLDEVRLGESTVNEQTFEQTISFFVGYQF